MAFFVLEVLSGLEIDGVSQILTLFKNVADGGRTPTVHIFESLVFVHTLSKLCKVSRWMGYPQEDILQRMDRTISDYHIEDLMGRSVFALSGGEKQKIPPNSAASRTN